MGKLLVYYIRYVLPLLAVMVAHQLKHCREGYIHDEWDKPEKTHERLHYILAFMIVIPALLLALGSLVYIVYVVEF